VLAVLGGILIASFPTLVDYARAGDLGLGPYTLVVMFTLGMFGSTFVFSIYFFNLPVGDAPEVRNLLRGPVTRHLLGWLGGALWCVGTVSWYVVAAASGAARSGEHLLYGAAAGSALLAALWGLLLWHEFAGTSAAIRTRILLAVVLFAAAVVLATLARQ
jgi:glucose uptake protein